jgi:ATP adenylyltransferase/5',5'''-P-1,P-4-tetraphosphate phosphorylase II
LPDDLIHKEADDRPVCFGPGSDIAFENSKLLVNTINGTHLLVISKFCVFRPHLMLLTVDSYRRQRTPLQLDDIAAACLVLTSVGTPHFAFYNCTPAAGSSREHKHVQLLPKPGHFFPDEPDYNQNKIPFQHFYRNLRSIDMASSSGQSEVLEIYLELLAMTKQALSASGDVVSHNVVLVKEWIVVIPRRSNNYNGVTANAAGMMGYVWLANESSLEGWKTNGLTKVLPQLGLPL